MGFVHPGMVTRHWAYTHTHTHTHARRRRCGFGCYRRPLARPHQHTHTHTQPCMRLRVSCLPYAWPCLRPASPATDGRTTALASRSPHPSTAPLSSSSSRAACQQHATLAPDLQAAQSKRAERTCSSSAWGRLGAQQPASDAALGGQGVVHGTHMGTRLWSSSSTSMRAYIRSAIDTSKLDSRAGAVRTGTCTCTCTHTHTCTRTPEPAWKMHTAAQSVQGRAAAAAWHC